MRQEYTRHMLHSAHTAHCMTPFFGLFGGGEDEGFFQKQGKAMEGWLVSGCSSWRRGPACQRLSLGFSVAPVRKEDKPQTREEKMDVSQVKSVRMGRDMIVAAAVAVAVAVIMVLGAVRVVIPATSACLLLPSSKHSPTQPRCPSKRQRLR
ncbi:hypothetical protein LZ31DRAFT_206129 [Colletotrichum somersetense]|nr:hypothetical protein LZ31DRAFT_206129 [Colletotrichum somersetense]